MDIYSIIGLIGGLALFLFGMHELSTGLEKVAGSKLEKMLKRMTSTKFKGLLLGAGVTMAIQSSSAMTVMLVGLVNSGIMQLEQTVGIIMGTNIGTTATAWILSLQGVESDFFLIQMLKPDNFSPVLAFIGVILILVSKKTKKRDIGSIMMAFAILMYGMHLMSNVVSPLKDVPEFVNLMTAFSNPLFGVIVGTVFTAIIQSSSASVGVLQALSMTGSITYGTAIPIIMGQNIGTCVTALLSSIGVNKSAKRVSIIHISFNLIGTAFCLLVLYGSDLLFHWTFWRETIDITGIAACHSIFNVVTTLLLFPLSNLLVQFAKRLIKDTEKNSDGSVMIDDRLLNTPSVAIAECSHLTSKMAALSRDAILDAFTMFENYSNSVDTKVREMESSLDNYEDRLGTYLVKLSSKELSDVDSGEISKMLHAIGDFERLGDHGRNLLGVAGEMHDKNIRFSEKAIEELTVVTQAVQEIVRMATCAYESNDLSLAAKVEPLKQVIDSLIEKVKENHILRLKQGHCTIELGFVLSDYLTNCKRISDHSSNIAVVLLRITNNNLDTHQYINEIRQTEGSNYSENRAIFEIRYHLQ